MVDTQHQTVFVSAGKPLEATKSAVSSSNRGRDVGPQQTNHARRDCTRNVAPAQAQLRHHVRETGELINPEGVVVCGFWLSLLVNASRFTVLRWSLP